MPLLRNLHMNDNHLLQLPGDLLVIGKSQNQFCDHMIDSTESTLLLEIGETDQSAAAAPESRQLSTRNGAEFRHFAQFGCAEHFE